MTEGSDHTAEYVPYFLKNNQEIENHSLTLSGYLDICDKLDIAYRKLQKTIASNENIIDTPYMLSREYAAKIINAVVTNTPFVFNGNVHNRGGALISNLPGDSCVEVACVADAQGIRPTAVGDLPPQCAALMRTNINVQDLAVRGILEGNRNYIHQAVMLDPNTASQLTIKEIDSLVDDMFKAHEMRLPENLKR